MAKSLLPFRPRQAPSSARLQIGRLLRRSWALCEIARLTCHRAHRLTRESEALLGASRRWLGYYKVIQ